jgi:hypothetical protein
MNRTHTFVIGAILVLVVAPGLGVVGAVGTGAVGFADQQQPSDGGLETAAQPIAETHPVVKEAIRDWADDQRLTDETRKKLAAAAGEEFDKKELQMAAASVRSEYEAYDLALLLKLYGSDDPAVNVMVKYGPDATASQVQSAVRSADSGATVKYVFEDLNVVAVEGLDRDAVSTLGSNARVEQVMLDPAVYLPRSTQAQATQGSSTDDWDVEAVDAESLWQQGYKGDGVRVAVLDSGIDDTHPDLDETLDGEDKVVAEEVFVDPVYTTEPTDDGDGHGTHVAGIVAGTGDASNGQYMGVAPNAKLLNAKVFNNAPNDGVETASDIIAAVEWAVDNDADVISMSLGAGGTPNGESELSQAVDDAVEQGVFVSVASGNDGDRPLWYYFR